LHGLILNESFDLVKLSDFSAILKVFDKLAAMITFFTPKHHLHAPEYEFFRGERVACFESPARADFVYEELVARGHDIREPDVDSTKVLRQVHTARYLAFLETAWAQWVALDTGNTARQPFPSVWPVRTLRSDVEPQNYTAKLGLYSMDNGTPMVAGTWAAAKAGADAAASAAIYVSRVVVRVSGESVNKSTIKAAFCATRPPGHHAGADFMGGYCFLNNAAVAVQTLRNQGSAKVAILDVDYHHGNGTQSIFYDRADVLFVSIHGDPRTEYPFYLGHADEVGEGLGQGFNLNLPLPAGSSKAAWFAALATACEKIKQFGAKALVVSLGLDTFADDPISTFALQSADYTELGAHLKLLGLTTVFILEGGYAAKALGVNAGNVLRGFEGNI
jgi:acetoin utilization deacetylase AcuC-like enzyme